MCHVGTETDLDDFQGFEQQSTEIKQWKTKAASLWFPSDSDLLMCHVGIETGPDDFQNFEQ